MGKRGPKPRPKKRLHEAILASCCTPQSVTDLQKNLTALVQYYVQDQYQEPKPPSLPQLIKESEYLKEQGLLNSTYQKSSIISQGTRPTTRYSISSQGQEYIQHTSLSDVIKHSTHNWNGEKPPERKK